MGAYWKTLSALLGAISTWGVTAFVDNGVSAAEWFGLFGALSTAIGVFATKNTETPEGNTVANEEDDF